VKRFLTVLAASIACVLACASERMGRTKLADGSYEIKCKKPLGECLVELANVCRDYGYDIVFGKEEKERFGVEPMQTEVITSRATIRCRSAIALLSLGDKTAPATSAPPAASPVVARCFPGGTQACLGPGACKGAQTCRGDGAGYGACDCGGAAPPRPVPDAEASDAGPPATWSAPPTDGAAPP
jgi:hypothetical protein